MESMHPFKSYWVETNNKKTKSEKGHNSQSLADDY